MGTKLARDVTIGDAVLNPESIEQVVVKIERTAVLGEQILTFADGESTHVMDDDELRVADPAESMAVDLADGVLDALYSGFGNATGCPVEDSDVTGSFREALVIALARLDAAVTDGVRLRCGFCGADFAGADTCPQGCAEQDVNGGTALAHRVVTP